MTDKKIIAHEINSVIESIEKNTIGSYQLIDKDDIVRYVGSTVDVKRRLREHNYRLANSKISAGLKRHNGRN